jgi:tetratricopeptide (TPR) repeat protein
LHVFIEVDLFVLNIFTQDTAQELGSFLVGVFHRTKEWIDRALVSCGVFQDTGDHAIEHYQLALDADPKDVYTHNDLGRALVTLGRVDESLRQHKQAVEIDPKFARAWNDYGIALRLSGRLDDAEECFNKALQIGPRDTFALYQLGVTFIAAGKTDKAIESFRHAIQIDDKYILAHMALGEALLSDRQFAAATIALNKCLEILPLGDPQRGTASKLIQRCESEQATESPHQ